MGRRSRTRRLHAWMNGELVGHWTITAQGRHEFSYAESWLDNPASRPVSLSMPLRPAGVPYRDDIVETYFDNLLPDSRDIRRRVQARFGTASTAPFDLLAEIGRECVGALQLLSPDAIPEDINRIKGERKTDDEVAAILRGVVATPALGQHNDDAFRISIAGAQEKTALLWHKGAWHRPRGATPTTHIFKLPLGRVGNQQLVLTTSVENEWLCSRIVRAFGIPVAQCEMGQFEEQRVLIVERFDRRLSPDRHWWMRLPQEDMCQATGTPPDHRYESDGGPGIARVMEVLLGAREAQQDRCMFFKAQVLFWMLCAIDGHAKNFSVFIEPHGRYALTPLYDVISAYPFLGSGAKKLAPQKAKMAMAVSSRNRHYHWQKITRQHWLKTAGASGLASADAERLIDELVHSVPAVVEAVGRELPKGFPASVAGPVFKGMQSAATQLEG